VHAVRATAEGAFQSNIQENKDWNVRTGGWPAYSNSFQSNIQENKDWNSHSRNAIAPVGVFQSNIQENKDWNKQLGDVKTPATYTFRATSKRTRIETRPGFPGILTVTPAFRATSKRTRIETKLVYYGLI